MVRPRVVHLRALCPLPSYSGKGTGNETLRSPLEETRILGIMTRVFETRTIRRSGTSGSEHLDGHAEVVRKHPQRAVEVNAENAEDDLSALQSERKSGQLGNVDGKGSLRSHRGRCVDDSRRLQRNRRSGDAGAAEVKGPHSADHSGRGDVLGDNTGFDGEAGDDRIDRIRQIPHQAVDRGSGASESAGHR